MVHGCPDPCKYKGRFVGPEGVDPNHCENRHRKDMANTERDQCIEFRNPDLSKPHPFRGCLKSCEQDRQLCTVVKEEADKSCLYNVRRPTDECLCDDMPENQNLTDIPEPVKVKPTTLSSQLKNSDYAVTEYKRADESGNPPCYMPQPNDDIPQGNNLEPMGPIGPWATGKVDWSPLAGLTGTRPVVDQYSITRFSTNEWRQRNKELLNKTFNAFEDANKNDNNSRNIMTRTYAIIDKTQADSTKMVRDRAQLVNRWKQTLERAIKAMIDEITTLEEQRLRLKQSLSILRTPESIASECIQRRCGRPETELIRDMPEEELVKELALIAEIRTLLNKTLADIETQQIENRTARNRMEYDWSDKKDAYEIESMNVALNNLSTITMFRPGATRFPEEQASEEYWEHFTKETLEECEKCRQKSVALRNTLDAILLNAARDLRTQADTIEKAFTVRIACMQENLNRLENELRNCLQNLTETENRILRLHRGMQGLDNAMKVAQTRLDNKSYRPHVENCRDRAQVALVDEVKTVQDGVSAMLFALNDAEKVKNTLMITRSDLEREIMLKRRTLMLDRDRCMLLRSHFPSANALSGYSQV